MTAQELEAVNAKIASAAVSGRLDRNPFVQGLLVQLMDRLEKEEKGILTMRGRRRACTATEKRLLEDAALTLSILGGNSGICAQLGQKVTKPRIQMDELPSFGLPNPALSIMFPEQLEENFILVDQLFSRRETSRSRRLMMAVDATYLLRSANQFQMNGKIGLVGGSWASSDESQAFLDLSAATKSLEKAPVMQEFLLWDPCSYRKETYSIAAMPMSLSAPVQKETETKHHAGNWEARRILFCYTLLMSVLFSYVGQ